MITMAKKQKPTRKVQKSQGVLWFKAKHYGWGWYPCSWQGWTVMLIWIALVWTSMSWIPEHQVWNKILHTIIFTAILITICYKKGESPRWRWG